jgi:hypothetical protein
MHPEDNRSIAMQIPNPRCAIIRCRNHQGSVGAKRSGIDPTPMPLESDKGRQRLAQIPHASGTISGRGDHEGSVGAKRGRIDTALMPLEFDKRRPIAP